MNFITVDGQHIDPLRVEVVTPGNPSGCSITMASGTTVPSTLTADEVRDLVHLAIEDGFSTVNVLPAPDGAEI